MKQTDVIIFKLLQISLFPEHESSRAAQKELAQMVSAETDWESILKELAMHASAAIPAEWVMQSKDVPSDVKNTWMDLALLQVGQWTNIMESQQELVQLMQAQGIEIAIIKGSAAGIYYPHPEYRAMGDIDFIVKKEKAEQACRVMLAHGYTFAHGEQKGWEHLAGERFHHVELEKNGVTFELHKKMHRIQAQTTDNIAQEMIQKELDHVKMYALEPYQVPGFFSPLNGLILLRHMIQHLGGVGEGIGLRHLTDWMMFVHTHLDDTAWENTFCPMVEEMGLKTVAVTFTRMCQMYLGLREDGITWCREADSSLCSAWIEEIMRLGNFGCKEGNTGLGVNVIFRNRNVFAFLKSLQTLGLHHWSAARKYPILRPFAWAYQIYRYIRTAFLYRYSMKYIRGSVQKGKTKKNLMEQLQIRDLRKDY